MSLLSYKLLCAGIVLLVTLLSAAIPFKLRYTQLGKFKFPIGNALAAGVFLGVALLHMLAEAAEGMRASGIEYPLAYLLLGITFLILLLLEHVGMEVQHRNSHEPNTFIALLALFMLSFHSLFAGMALGSSDSIATVTIILVAILSHKWAESFALAVELNSTPLIFSQSISLFSLYASAVPAGVAVGSLLSIYFQDNGLLVAILNATAAGTFLYIGTLHGLHQSVMVDKCCDLKTFMWVIVGFGLMALVPFWVGGHH